VWLLTLLVTLVSLSGCSSNTLTNTQRAAQSREQRALTFAGEWSDPVHGVRCRIRLSSTQVRETERLRSALELWNDSQRAIELNNTAASKFARASVWTLGNELYFSESLDLQNVPENPVRLAPGERFLIGPALLRVTPAVAPRVGLQSLSASTLLRTDALVAPAAMISVLPAQWGSAGNGLRLCIGIDSATLDVSDPVAIYLYIHNTTNERVALVSPDWAHPQIRSEDDLITLTFTARRGAAVVSESPRVIQRRKLLPGKLFDRSGVYRICVVLDAPPLSFLPKGVWTGSAVSNELSLQVQAAQKPPIIPNLPSTGPGAVK
jgi:hypothetical protein